MRVVATAVVVVLAVLGAAASAHAAFSGGGTTRPTGRRAERIRRSGFAGASARLYQPNPCGDDSVTAW
jgi:hypothetical protein